VQYHLNYPVLLFAIIFAGNTPSVMGKKPASALSISDRRQELLRQHIAKRSTPVSEINRISILLKAANGCSNAEVARQLNMDYDTVSRWRKRWPILSDRLDIFEKGVNDGGVSDSSLLKEILLGLKDSPRSGTPPVIMESQKDQIVALACQKPSEHGLPVTHWTHEQLAKTAVEIGIVDKVSGSHIWRILKKKNFNHTKTSTGYTPK
jgi:transposase